MSSRHSEDDREDGERRSLLSEGQDRSPHYGSVSSHHSQEHSHSGMYQCTSVKLIFAIGSLLAAFNTFSLLYLLTLLYHPSLPSGLATTTPLLQTNLHLISLLILLPSLLFLEISSGVTSKIHWICLLLLSVLGILLLTLREFTENNSILTCLPAILSLAVAIAWSLVSGNVVSGLTSSYVVVDEQEGVQRIQVDSQHALPKWSRWLKVFFSVIGTSLITVLLVLLVANVALQGVDHSVKATGQRISVNVEGKKYRLHMGIEEAKSNNASAPWDGKPTAIFFPPIGVSGYTSSHWLRHMVQRTPTTPAPGGNGTEDGHLALRRAIWFDRLGTGLSDYVRNEEGLEFQALGVLDAIKQMGLLHKNASKTESQFMLISLHDGSLLANAFAATLSSQDYIHSQVFIDAETAGSYYSNDISPGSGLQRGYPRDTLSLLVRDFLPAIFSPLSPSKLLGVLFLGTTSRNRIFGDRHASAPNLPRIFDKIPNSPASNYFFSTSAASTSSKTYLTLLSHHLDSSDGKQSGNYQYLNSHSNLTTSLARTKPTAILSSFWKLNTDPSGWSDVVQRQSLVKPSLDAKTLVGWWKVGSPLTSLDKIEKGDLGYPEGLCANKAQGRVWCEEAIRKVLAWDLNKSDLNAVARL
ncbi:unnamed protein product [Sympodiomycopsis kandeliae]